MNAVGVGAGCVGTRGKDVVCVIKKDTLKVALKGAAGTLAPPLHARTARASPPVGESSLAQNSGLQKQPKHRQS